MGESNPFEPTICDYGQRVRGPTTSPLGRQLGLILCKDAVQFLRWDRLSENDRTDLFGEDESNDAIGDLLVQRHGSPEALLPFIAKPATRRQSNGLENSGDAL